MVASKRGKNPANRWSRNRIPSKRADDQTLEQEMVTLKNIGMSVLPVLITAVIAVGCNSPMPTISDLSAAGARLDATVLLMKGKWQGAYEALDPSYDTVFYSSLKEKTEYLLSGSVADSSLIKDVSIRDTFNLRIVAFEFELSDATSWTGMAQVIFAGDSIMKLPATMNMVDNLDDGPIQMKFGVTSDTVSNETRFYEDIKAAAHISFQDAFLSQSFILAIDHLSEDSLRFSLPGGYGKMNLTRKNNPKRFETF